MVERQSKPAGWRAVTAATVAAALAATVLLPSTALATGEAPSAVDDHPVMDEDTTLVDNVLDNDTDPEGDTLHVSSVSGFDPATGTGKWFLDGTFMFTPKANFNGEVTAWYTVSDGTAIVKAWVYITVNPVEDPPRAVNDTVTVVEDTPADVTAGILANDTDPDAGDTLEVAAVSNATGGAVDLAGGVVTFTPAENLCGDAAGSFDYTLTDGTLDDDGTVTVDITCVNDPPDVADDTAAGTEDEDVVIPEADLLANASDVEGDDLSIAGVGGATHGSVSTDGTDVTFVPAADYCGTAAFSYDVADGTDEASGTVTITLDCVNDAPVAVDDTATVGQGSSPADHDVLANDTDVDGDDLVVSNPAVDPAAGTVSVESNQVRYAPDPAFTGDAVITYTVSDGTASDTGTLTVTVVPDAVAPAVGPVGIEFGSARVNEKAPLLVSWSGSDAETGIKGFELQVRIGDGSWTTVYAGTGTSFAKRYPFRTGLQWRVRATDNADNVSEWVMSPVRRLVDYQGGGKVAWSGAWVKVKSKGSSGTNYRYTTTAGKKVRLTFTGLGVLYVAPKLTSGGYAKVKISGTVHRVRLKASTRQLGRIMASRMWTTSGEHTIKVINDQGGRRTTFDAFIVLK